MKKTHTQPSHTTHHDLVTLFQAGNYTAMEQLARDFLRMHPDDGHGWHMLGLSLVVRGLGKMALQPLLRASDLLPQNVDVWDHLGSAYKQLGLYIEAMAAFRKALNLRPNHAVSYNNLGNVFIALNQYREAETNYRRALRCQPNYGQAYGNLGMSLAAQGQFSEALEQYAHALRLRPNDADIHVNHANCLKELGQTDAALTAYENALRYAPNHIQARANMLLLQAFSSKFSPSMFLESARELGRVATGLADYDRLPPLQYSKNQRHRLRIGYVSGDFCDNHPVPFFLGPVLEHHEHQRVELFLYPTREVHDATARRLAGYVEHWTPLFGMTDRDAALRIRNDGIDVLIDLSGHCRSNRLGVFARRAAPVQAHFLGYCATTGIEQMDYWIGDKVLFPPDAREQFSESPWMLPRVWMSYDGRTDLPASGWHPSSDDTVWVGTFNHLSKIQDMTMNLWAEILHALPNVNLLLKSGQLDQTENRKQILSAFASRGIHEKRLRLFGSTPDWREHMAAYDKLDIALDPIDVVSGATTTCDTLWMGVPVVTLVGNTVRKRMAASLLTGLGRPEWAVQTTDAYKETVIRLVNNATERTALRRSQRDTMLHSALCDPRQLSSCLEDAFEEMIDNLS